MARSTHIVAEEPAVDMILLDWTRMGKSYCLAGVVQQDGRLRVVRPLPAHQRHGPVRNVGWSPYLMDGRSRWEVFELVGFTAADSGPPHLEDTWVQGLRSRGRLAAPALRRAALQATLTPPGEPLFGAELTTTRGSAYLAPDTGGRSLAGVIVPAREVHFSAVWRDEVGDPDYRVTLALPGLEGRQLPVKDHFLLQRAEFASPSLEGRVRALTQAVQQMGETVAVRLGLSRPYPVAPDQTRGVCWLMADGFFSLDDPQP